MPALADLSCWRPQGFTRGDVPCTGSQSPNRPTKPDTSASVILELGEGEKGVPVDTFIAGAWTERLIDGMELLAWDSED